MNFNTANSTFRQLMGNGLSYRVPMFQRDYSWGPDEWDDLWQDIVALFDEDPEPAHYMGYLVLQSADNRAFRNHRWTTAHDHAEPVDAGCGGASDALVPVR